MKTLFPILVFTSSVVLSAQAQVGQQAVAVPAASAPAAALSRPTAYAPVERGRDHTTWESHRSETNLSGRVIIHTNRMVELETGRHYSQNGQWLESREEIQIVGNGALATNGPHKVGFTVNINSAMPVAVTTPDNTRLKIRPLGLAYYDSRAEKQILIAELKDADGLVVGANQVLYPDAFTGFKADVRYTYKRSGLEQDVIIRQRPPLPEAYGLNPDTTWLLVLTEFIDPPANVQVARQIRRGWKKSTVDKVIKMGGMSVSQGTAFGLGLGQSRRAGVPVQKHWTVIDGRTILIEEVSFRRIVPQFRNLQASVQPARSRRHLASTSLVLPPVQVARATTSKPMQLAGTPPKTEGLVLDFDLQSVTDMVLQGDTTYVVKDTVSIDNVVIEGGTVVKYTQGAALSVGTVQCLTGPYHPAIFTAVDDDSVGSPTSTGTLAGTYADCALSLSLGGDLKYLNIRYANEAIYSINNNYSVNDAQFLSCNHGLHSEYCDFTNCNVLMYGVGTPYYGSYFSGRVEHLTCDQANVLAEDWDPTQWYDCGSIHESPSAALTMVNSLVVAVANGDGGFPITYDHVQSFPSADGVFQTAGAGTHYLVDGSANRNAGTTGIQTSLGAKTTFPPMVWSNVVINADTTLWPTAQRDTDVPDLGYHYDPIDYLCSCSISNATLTLANGVVLAYNDAIGVQFNFNSHLVSHGTASQRNYLVHNNLVQELPTSPAATDLLYAKALTGIGSSADMRFTTLRAPLGSAFIASFAVSSFNMQDCEVYARGAWWGQAMAPTPTTVTFRNNLFDVFTFEMWSGLAADVSAANNLFISPHVVFANEGTGTWIERDNAFDGCLVWLAGTFDHNAYLNGAILMTGSPQPSDIIDDMAWEIGPLGNYYQPIYSRLIDAGSSSAAAAGLYHYTVVPLYYSMSEADWPTLDIGYHYLALDYPSCQPCDTDGDNVPDYLEDANGNGVTDSGERDWQVSENGTTGVAGLQVFTPLK